jgi:transposase
MASRLLDFGSPRQPDRLGGQATAICLAHLIRDVQYAIDQGDGVLGPGLKGLLKRACAIGRRREDLADSTLKAYEPQGRAQAAKDLQGNPLASLRLPHTSEADSHQQRLGTGLAPVRHLSKDHQRLRSEWAAKLYADVPSAIETARRNCIRAIDAIRLTLQGAPLVKAV